MSALWQCSSAATLVLALASCSDDAAETLDVGSPPIDLGPAFTTSFFRDIKTIIDGRCVGCHQAGSIGPFDLTDPAEVARLAAPIANQVMTAAMPPWPPDNQCRSYRHDRSLTAEQRALIQTWADEGAPLGSEADYPGPLPGDGGGINADLELAMAEPYTPEGRDDYR
ncbi:MAG: hypothetical protein AAFU79_12925 [Myxococcota bacterium]